MAAEKLYVTNPEKVGIASLLTAAFSVLLLLRFPILILSIFSLSLDEVAARDSGWCRSAVHSDFSRILG
jgi:Na+(H+)/acetate symporter ActP